MLLMMHARQTKATVDSVTIQQAQYELQVAEHNAKYHDNYQPKTRMGSWRAIHVNPTPAPSAVNASLTAHKTH
jgi:hypothetical protein